jgi:hypothetical protein
MKRRTLNTTNNGERAVRRVEEQCRGEEGEDTASRRVEIEA